MKIISICSGKGGVGKTTLALNLGAALHQLNKSVIIIDLNLTTAHLGLALGMYNTRTVNNFLRGECRLEEAINFHPSGLKIIPASLELNDLANVNTDNLREKIRQAFERYDFVIIDAAPGIGREALLALKSCDEVLFVGTPHIPAIVDILKTKELASSLGFQLAGIVVNRKKGKKYELQDRDIFDFAGMPVIAEIPEDESILKCTNARSICLTSYPKAKVNKSFIQLACKLAGVAQYKRPGW